MFSSKWIAPAELQSNMHVHFKRQFSAHEFESAKMRITADDFYKLYINGSYVGEGPAPSFSFRYRFNEYDISDCLREGENTIEVFAYYQGLTNRVWVSGDGKVGLIADVFIDEKYCFGTDGSWNYTIDKSFIGGEKLGYDTAFSENRDFTVPPETERQAKEIDLNYTFDDAPFPAIEVERITAEPVKNGNKYFFDFNREYVGTPEIKAYSKADGGTIIIRLAEELDEKGNARFDTRCGCKYEEKCTLKKGENLIRQYDYKGFRYMEIIADDNIQIIDAAIMARHFPFPDNAQKINLKNEKLNAVFQLCSDTIHYGVQESLIDCPTREKGQYLGDVYISGFAHFYLTGDSRLVKKALCDFADSVKFSGRFLSVAPCSYQQKIADYDLLYPDFLLKYYLLTKDRKTLEELAPACETVLNEYAKYENENGLLEDVKEGWNLVDWPENMRDGYEYRPDGNGEYGFHNVINAYYIFALVSMKKICAVLNREFTKETDGLIEEYNKAFFNEKTKLYLDCKGGAHSSLHSNILPLAFGICPDENRENLVKYVINKGMSCSVYMSYFYLKALCVSGYEKEALGFITSENENSWMNMLKEGATATFESWNKEQKWNTSLFHPWATSPILIINEYLNQKSTS